MNGICIDVLYKCTVNTTNVLHKPDCRAIKGIVIGLLESDRQKAFLCTVQLNVCSRLTMVVQKLQQYFYADSVLFQSS